MHPSINMPIVLLCLLVVSILSKSHAKESNKPTSLVLGLNHARSLSSSMGLVNSTKFGFLDIIEPVTTYTDGYLLSLNLGTPPQVFQVYLDTGSDLTWVPCGSGSGSYQCIECGGGVSEHGSSKQLLPPSVTPTFSPSLSASSSGELCGSRFCVDVHSSDNPHDPCAAAGCAIPAFMDGLQCPRPCPPFSYTYGGGALVLGSLARDTVALHASIHGAAAAAGEFPVGFPGFCFGCVGSSIREPLGIAGFGRGALSLPSQLGFLDRGFSHCFLGFRFARNPNVTSPLVMGDLAVAAAEEDGGFAFTPMLESVAFPGFYYVGLEGVSVGDADAVAAPPSLRGVDAGGGGGVVVDTGTTYTHLPGPFFASVMASVRAAAPPYERSYELEARTGFGLCFRVPCARPPCSGAGAGGADDGLPPISLHFVGGAKVTLPRESCYYAVTAPRNSVVVKCLLLQRTDEEEEEEDYGDGGGGEEERAMSGPGAVLGSFQMQNVEVVYDLEAGRVGFKPRDCSLAE